MVAKLPPLELHSGVAGIDFPRPLQKAGAGKIFDKMASTHCMHVRQRCPVTGRLLTLAELEALAGALLSVLLALFNACVAGQQTISL